MTVCLKCESLIKYGEWAAAAAAAAAATTTTISPRWHRRYSTTTSDSDYSCLSYFMTDKIRFNMHLLNY